jgi:HAD superfamily hydrolase (TIGR01450 family)
LEAVRAVAFDLDGTIYLQGTPLPGALELLDALRRSGTDYLFVTNNSSVSGATYLDKLAAIGLQPTRSQVLTSNDVAITHLIEAGIKRPYLMATAEVRADYLAAGLQHEEEDPDAVLLTFDTSLTFQKLALATRHVGAGLPYLATHPDVTCPIEGGFLPDTGSFIELFAAATGRRPQVLGKPHAGMISEIVRRLQLPAPQIAFVGDRLQTDIQMAADAGFVSVLTLTGVTQPGGVDERGVQPDVIVSGMPELRRLLEAGVLGA